MRRTHEARVWTELYPRVLRLALRSPPRHDINFTIDAEEADRLALSLKLLDRLAPRASSWATGTVWAWPSRPIRSAARWPMARRRRSPGTAAAG